MRGLITWRRKHVWTVMSSWTGTEGAPVLCRSCSAAWAAMVYDAQNRALVCVAAMTFTGQPAHKQWLMIALADADVLVCCTHYCKLGLHMAVNTIVQGLTLLGSAASVSEAAPAMFLGAVLGPVVLGSLGCSTLYECRIRKSLRDCRMLGVQQDQLHTFQTGLTTCPYAWQVQMQPSAGKVLQHRQARWLSV